MARSRELLISEREPREDPTFTPKREVKVVMGDVPPAPLVECGWDGVCTKGDNCCGDHDCSDCHPWICPDCGMVGTPGLVNDYGPHHDEGCDWYEE
jgi:hypothetical protein